MSRKVTTLGLAALVLFQITFAAVAFSGGVAAAGNTTHADRTLSVSDDTRSLYVSAENASDVLDVTIHGIDNESITTEVDTGTVDATANSTDSYEFAGVDPTTYPEYRIQVTGPENSTVETLEVSKVEVVAGGGMIPRGSETRAAIIGAVVLAVIAGAFVYAGRY